MNRRDFFRAAAGVVTLISGVKPIPAPRFSHTESIRCRYHSVKHHYRLEFYGSAQVGYGIGTLPESTPDFT